MHPDSLAYPLFVIFKQITIMEKAKQNAIFSKMPWTVHFDMPWPVGMKYSAIPIY